MVSAAAALADSIDEALWFGEDDADRADKAAAESFAAALARVHDLRPMPAAVQRVLEELQRPDWSRPKVTQWIEYEPTLAGMVLRLANSSFYARGNPVSDVRQAITRLGAGRLHELVASAGAMQVVRGTGALCQRWREHAAGTAAIARVLAARTGVDPSTAFLAGLMHDIGKLLLLETEEMDYTDVPEAHEVSDEGLPALERYELGFDHAVLGGHVLRDWGLPEPLPQLVAWHHQPARAYAGDHALAKAIATLRAADRLAEAFDHRTELDLEAFCASTDGAWLELDAATLEAQQGAFAEARAEALTVFGR